MQIYSIGYQERSLPDVIVALKMAGVERVIDVHDLPNSRRAGFSKRQLAAGLNEAGIDYRHLKALGTPKAGRLAARAWRWDELWSIVGDALASPAGQLALQKAAALIVEKPSALLCYELDHSESHRDRVAKVLKEMIGLPCVHLGAPLSP